MAYVPSTTNMEKTIPTKSTENMPDFTNIPDAVLDSTPTKEYNTTNT